MQVATAHSSSASKRRCLGVCQACRHPNAAFSAHRSSSPARLDIPHGHAPQKVHSVALVVKVHRLRLPLDCPRSNKYSIHAEAVDVTGRDKDSMEHAATALAFYAAIMDVVEGDGTIITMRNQSIHYRILTRTAVVSSCMIRLK